MSSIFHVSVGYLYVFFGKSSIQSLCPFLLAWFFFFADSISFGGNLSVHSFNFRGFPGGSMGKESACNAGDARDSGLIPGWGRSPGGGHGNPLQYSCLENPMDRGAWQSRLLTVQAYSPWGRKESDTTEVTEHAHFLFLPDSVGRLYISRNLSLIADCYPQPPLPHCGPTPESWWGPHGLLVCIMV